MQQSIAIKRPVTILSRLRRFAGLSAATILVVIGAALAWYSLAAFLRETVEPGRHGHPGTYIEAAGLDIHYKSWGPPTGTPILLIHGTLAWSDTWYEIADRLAKRGFYVIAPDLPPFGFSERPGDGDYSRKAQAGLILGFADSLGLRTFVLAGHSFGAGATLEAAFAAPDRIERLLLLDAALGLDNPAGSSMIASLFGAPVLGRALTASPFTNPLMTSKGLRDFIYDDRIVDAKRIALYQQPFVLTNTSSETAKWLAGALYADESRSLAADPANYAKFDRPVVLVWGRQDSVTPLAQGEHIRSLLPRATLVVLDHVNHIPHVEKPEEVADIIAEFAGSLGGQETPLPQALLRRTH
ncbi:alpha/beta fold hydrolase [Rhizobium sp. LjRoot254]|uniref:alpha/beta fold hydrolase n=1 Tax=Rhizobium sp. LjRoot254 TaxID=3342297 RepID=UPI003ECF5A9A